MNGNVLENFPKFTFQLRVWFRNGISVTSARGLAGKGNVVESAQLRELLVSRRFRKIFAEESLAFLIDFREPLEKMSAFFG